MATTAEQVNLIASRLRGGVIDRTIALKQIKVILTAVDPVELVLGYALQHQTDAAAVLAANRSINEMEGQHATDSASVRSYNERRIALETQITEIRRIVGDMVIP